MLLAPFTSDQQAEHRQMVAVNLLGAITATEVFLDQLRDGGGDLPQHLLGGRSHRSAWQRRLCRDQVGINGWSEALRQKLQPDVRVTIIEPGAVATELTDHITHAETDRAAKQYVKDCDQTRGHRRDHRLRGGAAPSHDSQPARSSIRPTAQTN